MEYLWGPPMAALLLGYLLGAIPFGLMLTRIAGGGDLRAIGSGNIGATNVLRTGRKGLAALTLILDAGKGAGAVFLAEWIAPGLGPVGAAGAFFGHLYPVWLRFHGGKGVATLLGLTLVLCWPCGLVFAGVWIAVLAAFRYSSLAGMTAAASAPVAAAVIGQFDLAILFLALALMTVWKHRGNIERLLGGTEPRVGRQG